MTVVPGCGQAALVCGIGISGTAAAEVLLRRGASVTVVDGRDDDTNRVRAAALEALGAKVLLGEVASTPNVRAYDVVVTSPGWRPDQPLLAAAVAAGQPVWGEVELAWLVGDRATAWLCVTGTNGKTTTTEMLAAMLAAAGVRAEAAGNIGTPLLEAVSRQPAPAALAVELSSFQLHYSSSPRPRAAAILNVAPDHLDWHGGLPAYAEAKARIWARMGADDVAVANADDPVVMGLLARLDPAAGPRQVTFTLGEPVTGQLGVADGWLVDRAFGNSPLLAVDELRVAGPHNVANALAAAGLALAYGVPVEAVSAALRDFTAGAHRLATVAVIDGVEYVDDSKATNPHAAARAIASYERVVWIAGGLNKGLEFDDLVTGARDKLVAAVLIGRCAGEIRDALARHAPDIPVHDADGLHTAVRVARGLARSGDTVLLAPAAASMDMFRDYAERGDVFAAAVRDLAGETQGGER